MKTTKTTTCSMTTTCITMRFHVTGFHHWPEAPEAVAFLRDRHRHVFHIEAVKTVTHDDRNIEFILFANELRRHISMSWPTSSLGVEFGSASCEMIARNLLTAFELEQCTVLEDGENGAIINSVTTERSNTNGH